MDPDKSRQIHVTATFDGSESYFGSWDETSLLAQQGVAATSPPSSSELTLDAVNASITANIIAVGAAIIIAIAIVGILLLRRKK